MAKANGDFVTEASKALELARDSKSLTRPVSTKLREGFETIMVGSLQEGEEREGEFLGPGADIEMIDPKDNQTREIPSWRFRLAPGFLWDCPESAQLRKLATVAPGKIVIVGHLGQGRTRLGRMCNNFKLEIESDEHYTARTGKAPVVQNWDNRVSQVSAPQSQATA